jgi:glycerol-3-phosphate O-acyltransferase / dihydroxyacetone phosphate acyltransferase
MLYHLLRWLSAIALRWFYREIEIVGRERIPTEGPVMLAVNHPNALVDALSVVYLVPRRITLTAKATLFEVPVLGSLMRRLGIVPLRRAADEVKRDPARPVPTSRNAQAFDAMLDALESGQAVLIFPEGISHSEPHLSRLRTGLARVALRARDERGVRGLAIVPMGLVFEQKWRARTRVFAHVGEPIEMDTWQPPGEERDHPVDTLTTEVDRRLRASTLNFATADEAAWVLTLSRILSGVFDEPRPLGAPDRPLADELTIIRRIDSARQALAPALPERATRFVQRLRALDDELTRLGIPIGDIGISPEAAPGARFALREGSIIAGPGVLAWWGWVNHVIPLRLAATIARRVSAVPEDPAMYTLGVALLLLLIAYAIQTAAIWHFAGARWAMLYLLSLPLCGLWAERFQDRMRRARQRMRAYFQFRHDPTLRPRLRRDAEWLREEALALEGLTSAPPTAVERPGVSAAGDARRPDPSARPHA